MYNDAINDYTKAIEIDPKNAFAYYNVKIYNLYYFREEFPLIKNVNMIKLLKIFPRQ